MQTIASGDWVQILCASRTDEGTSLESETARATPYWVKTGNPERLKLVSDALIGKKVGESATFTFPVAGGDEGSNQINDLMVVAIKKPRLVINELS